MKAFYSPAHAAHDPPFEVAGAVRIDHPEKPSRAEAICQALQQADWAEVLAPQQFTREDLLGIHDEGYLEYLATIYPAWVAAGFSAEGVVPDCFPPRGPHRPPVDLVRRAGYYGIDSGTPIVAGTWEAARASAGCALSAAEAVAAGERFAYALCRPPGHHAGADYCAGFCYLNNAALAADRLRRRGAAKLAILDVDYHHGNGTQDLFWRSGAVFFASIHADPATDYPYYTGFENEQGRGPGAGCNLNLPLPDGTGEAEYLRALAAALEAIDRFAPEQLVLSLGADTYAEDPLGRFALPPESYAKIGRAIAALALPVVAVQEGGYNVHAIGACVAGVLEGLGSWANGT